MYGEECKIDRLECVGHVQKRRMATYREGCKINKLEHIGHLQKRRECFTSISRW